VGRNQSIEQLAVPQLGIVKQFSRRADRETRHRNTLRQPRHFLRRHGPRPFRHQGLQLEEIAPAFDARAAERHVLRPGRMAEQRDPAIPLVLLARRDHHPGMRAWQDPGQPAGCLGSFLLHTATGEHALARMPVRKTLESDVGVEIMAREVDVRRLPAGLRDQQAPHRGHGASDTDGKWPLVVRTAQRSSRLRVVDRPSHVVGKGRAMLQREIRRRRLRQRPHAAKRSDRYDDKMRVPRLQPCAIQLKRSQQRRRLALDQDRRFGEQRVQPVAVSRCDEVQHLAALAGVDIGEQRTCLGAGFTRPERSAPPQVIAAGWLNLDDVGTDITQDACAERGGDALAPFDDPCAGDQHRTIVPMVSPAFFVWRLRAFQIRIVGGFGLPVQYADGKTR
jgi:hypothetical protein